MAPAMRVTKANVTPDVRDLRAHAADGRAHAALLARRARVRRRLPALQRGRARLRLGARGPRRLARRSQQHPRRKRQKTLWQTLLGAREEETEPVVSEPILRRLSDDEIDARRGRRPLQPVQFRRTVAGVAKASASRRSRSSALPGVNAETVLTFAWDITWYQYRVTPDAAQPVRIADRGHDLDEVETDLRALERPLRRDAVASCRSSRRV